MKIKMHNSASRITAAFLLTVFTATVLTGCGKKKVENKTEEETETVFAVNAYKASPSSLDDYLIFGGNVQVASSVDFYPDANGKISRIYVKVGDKVKKNQILAEIDGSRPGMDYMANPVKAPIDGTVTSLPFSIGQTVAPSVSLGKISSTGQLEIKTNVAERFISRISLNQIAELTFDAYPGEKFGARLIEIDPVLDTTSRTLGIKFIQEPRNDKLKAGMYAKIRLITDTKKNTIIVPHNTIITRDDKEIIYVVNLTTNTAEAREVVKGIRVDDKQEIISGINPGDLVVVKGQILLSDGAKVKVVSVSE